MSRNTIHYLRAQDDAPELVLCSGEARNYPWHFHARHRTFGLVRSGSVLVTTLHGAFPLAAGATFVIPPLAPHKLGIGPHSSLAVVCASGASAVTDIRFRELAGDNGGADLTAWLADPATRPTLVVDGPALEELSPVAAVRNLLAARPDEHFSLAALAEFAGYSPWYFLRVFKKETGLTPHAFQLICRVSRARALLRSGTAAAEAAAASGFTDQSHLHKAFKLHHGLTPGEFVKAGVRPER